MAPNYGKFAPVYAAPDRPSSLGPLANGLASADYVYMPRGPRARGDHSPGSTYPPGPSPSRRRLFGLSLLAATIALTLLGVAASGRAAAVEPVFIVFAARDNGVTAVYEAPAGRIGSRRAVAAIEHAPGTPIYGAVSPDSRAIALLRVSARGPVESAAQLLIVDRLSGKTRLLAEGVDLPSPPVWRPDSLAVAVRRTPLGDAAVKTIEVLEIEIATGAASTLVAEPAMSLQLAGWDSAGRFWYSHIGKAGTELRTGSRAISLSRGIARDVTLSPNGDRVAFTTAAPGGGSTVTAIDLASERPIATSTHPAYARGAFPPSRALTIGSTSANSALRQVELPDQPGVDVATAAMTLMAGAPGGFELPLSWSPGGEWLIVRRSRGAGIGSITEQYLDVVSPAGGVRQRLGPTGSTRFLGWAETAP